MSRWSSVIKYVDQRSFRSNVFVPTSQTERHTDRHTHTTARLLYLDYYSGRWYMWVCIRICDWKCRSGNTNEDENWSCVFRFLIFSVPIECTSNFKWTEQWRLFAGRTTGRHSTASYARAGSGHRTGLDDVHPARAWSPRTERRGGPRPSRRRWRRFEVENQPSCESRRRAVGLVRRSAGAWSRSSSSHTCQHDRYPRTRRPSLYIGV